MALFDKKKTLKTPPRCLRTTEKAYGTVPRPSPAAPKTPQDAFKATLVATLRACKPLFSALFFQKNPRVRPSRKKEVGLIDFRAEKMGRTRNFWPKKVSSRGFSLDFCPTFTGLFPMFHHISITPRSTPDHPQIHSQINPRSTPRSTPDPPPRELIYKGL